MIGMSIKSKGETFVALELFGELICMMLMQLAYNTNFTNVSPLPIASYSRHAYNHHAIRNAHYLPINHEVSMSTFHFSPRPNRAHEINWHEWNDAAFAEAQTQDKPILLDIGAVWCHWCHVMDETSYSDSEIIRLINERFISIRVENDQRPDVNRRYNLGGWPTTAFLTPDGEIMTGGTYIPPSQFRSYLTQISDAYKNSRADIRQRIAAINLKRETTREQRGGNAQLSIKIIDNVAQDVLDNFDSAYGGFGDAPKFLHPDALAFALERYFATRDERFLAVVTVTLTNMASGGTYDQEAGGFFRYSTTRDWSVPHFEKMLEDNAKLFKVLVNANQVAPRDIFAKTIETMTAYLDSSLSDRERGGFYGSQDADEHYYSLPLAERAKLTAPYIDHTFYTNWNAMMISGYLNLTPLPQPPLPSPNEVALGEGRGAARSAGERGKAFALRTLNRLWNEMYNADAGLYHFCREGDAPQLLNQLSDLAYTTHALLDAYRVTADAVHLQRAQTLAELALDKLYDNERGAFWSEPQAHQSLGLLRLPDKSVNENAVMADALVRLGRLTGDEKYRIFAEKTLVFFSEEYSRYSFAGSEYALAVEHFLNEPVSVHIVGAVNDERTQLLKNTALAEYAPAKIVQVIDPMHDAERLKQLGYPTNATPLAYICVGQQCLAPVSDGTGIVAGIRQFTQRSL
jgi:uncharacterized protein YyaL (SSP411 family)